MDSHCNEHADIHDPNYERDLPNTNGEFRYLLCISSISRDLSSKHFEFASKAEDRVVVNDERFKQSNPSIRFNVRECTQCK
jgi:hypothetical protein